MERNHENDGYSAEDVESLGSHEKMERPDIIYLSGHLKNLICHDDHRSEWYSIHEFANLQVVHTYATVAGLSGRFVIRSVYGNFRMPWSRENQHSAIFSSVLFIHGASFGLFPYFRILLLRYLIVSNGGFVITNDPSVLFCRTCFRAFSDGNLELLFKRSAFQVVNHESPRGFIHDDEFFLEFLFVWGREAFHLSGQKVTRFPKQTSGVFPALNGHLAGDRFFKGVHARYPFDTTFVRIKGIFYKPRPLVRVKCIPSHEFLIRSVHGRIDFVVRFAIDGLFLQYSEFFFEFQHSFEACPDSFFRDVLATLSINVHAENLFYHLSKILSDILNEHNVITGYERGVHGHGKGIFPGKTAFYRFGCSRYG